MMKKQISNKLKTCLLSFSLILSACGGGPDSPLLQNPENREFFQTDAAVKSLLPGVAVSSAHPLATEAGLRTLQNGGNAFDAAVAISAALAVVEPASSGFGGGGFWLLHRESDGKQVVIDGREKAPSAATRDMYLNAKGEVIENLSKVGALAAGIPGMPAALVHINTNYGKLSLEDSLQPALEYAEEGFEMTPILSKAVQHRQKYFSADALKSFVDLPMLNNGLLVQTDLASVIKRLAQGGFNGFYQGETAKKLVEGVNSAGGIWAMSDLQEYNVIERQPVVFEYRDAKIITPPLPSSGGLVLQQILKVLEYKQQDLSPEVTHLDYHLLVESMRRAYRDRSVYMGDPDFISEDVSGLSDSTYIRSLAESIDLNKATPSQNLFDADQQFDQRQQGQDTTHFSVVDAQGNRVSESKIFYKILDFYN